jgi:hypothetical protein
MEGREVEFVGVGSPNPLGEHLVFAPEERYVYRRAICPKHRAPERSTMSIKPIHTPKASICFSLQRSDMSIEGDMS